MNGSYNIIGAFDTPSALSDISRSSRRKWGGSVMAALQIKNIPTGAGDDIKIDASWSMGDTEERDLHLGCFAELRDVRWHEGQGGA